MELDAVIEKRRTVRDFSPRAIPEAAVMRAVRAAFMAPSYNHLREWDFILISDRDVKVALTRTEEMTETLSPELIDAFKNVEESARAMYLEAIPRQKRMIVEAPCVIVVVFRPKTPVENAKRIYDLNGLASAWCAIENLLLSLARDDIYGVTFIPKNTPLVKEVLGIPADLEVAAVIPVGYKKDGAKGPKQKEIDVDAHVHQNAW
ncbi:nitroreductase family protein [bacterium]|nr:nitroreductase family protein [bacterium]